MRALIVVSIFFISYQLLSDVPKAVKGWPAAVMKIHYISAIDQTKQPTLIYTAKSSKKRPLLVALHSWSSNYLSAGGDRKYAEWAIAQDWHFVHPHFRGPNWTSKAMGSDYVVSDIVSIVEYMKKEYAVDEDRIYLIGSSGGGYASLLMAGRAPDIWAGVSSWVPITNIHQWWQEKNTAGNNSSRYAKNIESAVGLKSEYKKFKVECLKRSAITYLKNAKGLNIDIHHGIYDGRKGSVPFTHSLYGFNELASDKDKISEEHIDEYYKTLKLPKGLKPSKSDKLYGSKEALFRRISGNSRVTIFKGGHEMIHVQALNWLANQRKGKNAVWKLKEIKDFQTTDSDSQVSQ